MKNEKTTLEVNPLEIKRILLEARGLIWLLCKYRWNPMEFKHICYEELFDLQDMVKLLFELDSALASFGVLVETKM
ncbi:MAG: hypothetical protein ACFE9S_07485 [Candidatus Hermodarchaeota archaeon]